MVPSWSGTSPVERVFSTPCTNFDRLHRTFYRSPVLVSTVLLGMTYGTFKVLDLATDVHSNILRLTLGDKVPSPLLWRHLILM